MTSTSAERARVIRDIAALLERMEVMGESDMGALSYREARQFHAATNKLRKFIDMATNTFAR